MLKYAKVINEQTKQCEVGLGDPTAIFEEVEKVRTWQETEQQEQVVPAEYDEKGNLIKEETTEIIEVPVEKSETYIETMTVGDFYESIGMTLQDVEQAYNGNWYLTGYAPKQPLDELKALKRAEINKARDEAEQGGFEYLGKTFDSDQVSCIRMSSAAQAMQYAPDDATITWTTQDNSTIDLTKAQLAGLVVALAQHSNECHQKATELKAKTDACESQEELDAITWVDIVD